MLGWTILFLLLALVAALLGFGIIAGAAFFLAKILFFVFLAMFVISLIASATRTPRDVV
jgi:uncharacterized membrane protein YtjA (UPF0391 family)